MGPGSKHPATHTLNTRRLDLPPIVLKRSSAIRSIGRDFRRSLGFYARFEYRLGPVCSRDRWDLFVSSMNKHNNLPSGRGDIKVFDGTARTVAMQDPGRPAIPTNIHWITHLCSGVGRSGTEHEESASGQVGRFHELVQ